MIGYPLDSHVEFDENNIPVYDRAVSSAPLRKLIKELFSDGVMPNPSTNMQVVAGTGMKVVVKPGFAICNGCMKLEETQVILPLKASDTANPRIDTVVLRLNDNAAVRSCELDILTGIPSASPARPELTRDASMWEIGLADIKVQAKSETVTNANITDTRYETARCGVISSISEFDTTKIYQQVQTDLEELRAEEQEGFLVWFEQMKNQLSTDAAGNLQNQIEVERARINNLAKMEEGSTSGDAELRDIRVGANGIVYGSAGDAVREQFKNATEKQEANSAAIEGFLYPVTENITIAELTSVTCWDTGYYSEIGTTLPEEIPQTIPQGNINNCFTWSAKVNKGDVFGLHVAAINTMGARLPQQCLLITNKSRVVVGSISVQDLLAGTKYTAKEDGYLYLSGTYDSGLTIGMQYFWIKKYRDMSEIPSSGGVSQEEFEEEIGKLSEEKVEGIGIKTIEKKTQAEYDAMDSHDANTLYVIVG